MALLLKAKGTIPTFTRTLSSSTLQIPAMNPRPSASLILINSQNEVLLVKRTLESTSFAGMHVFPGGNVDPAQDPSLEYTALRETFEETGLLLASSAETSTPTLKDLEIAKGDIHAQRLSFPTFLRRHALQPCLELLMPFTKWVTPVEATRRFSTTFFLAFLPQGMNAGMNSAGDNGQEIVSASFVSPRAALDSFARKEIALMPPQYYILSTLASVLPERGRVETLAHGAFGQLEINPTRMQPTEEERRAGWTVLSFEGDESRGGMKGRKHRVLAKFAKGITTELLLQRDVDIFTEMHELVQRDESKL